MKTLHAVLSAALLFGSVASAQDKTSTQTTPPPMPMQMTREQRNKMADAHEKMAACLRSTKPLSECHQEMMQACKANLGAECPMMHMHGMHGMHGGQMPPPAQE